MTLIVFCVGIPTSARGQTVSLTGSFTGSSLDSGWTVGGSGYTPNVTAPSIDAAGSGWLRMTGTGTNLATFAYDTNAFAGAHATITATFNYASYGGSGADGITFFLADASKTVSAGANGGSLGYAQKTSAGGGGADMSGLNGGYLGVGFDEYGNFANPTEGRVGGTGSTLNAVSVRGPGQGLTGYNYLGGTGDLGNNSIAFPGSSTRPSGASLRTIQVVISATNQMTVYLATGGTGNFVPLYSIDLSGYTRPDNLIMGFTAGTGASTDIHEIQNVALTSVVSNLWTNGSGNRAWATASNWNNSPAAVPAANSDVLLDNTFVNVAQNITVAGTQVIRNLQIDTPFSYNLSGGSLQLDRGSVGGPSGIFVSQTHGSANQTIGSNISAANAIQIQNNSSGTLALTGTLNLGGSTATFNGWGNTTLSGIVSGAGGLVQSGTGNTTLSAANTYSGGTTLSAGALTVNNNTALGTGALVINGGNLVSTSASTLANTLTLQGDTTFTGTSTSGALTQTGGNYTVNLSGATHSGIVNLSESNSTSRTLTVQVDSGTATLSGVIQNNGGANTLASNLTKAGAGTLQLSGANTYTGTTTIGAGTLQLSASNVLATTSTLNIAGGTFNLNGNSNKIGNLTFSSGAAIDFGTGSTSNSFVFSGLTPAPSGVLTINNYGGPDSSNFAGTGDFLGTLTNTIAAATLNQLYFSGFGPGATENNNNLTSAGNGLGTAYRIAPTAITWSNYVWNSNGNQNWNSNGNWSNNNALNAYADFGYDNPAANGSKGTQFNPLLNANRTMAGIRFDANATGSYTVGGTGTLTMSNGTNLAFVQQQSSLDQTLSPAAIVLSSTTVFDITGAGNLTVGAPISGASSLTKTGSGGKLVLAGTNTYSGGTSVQSGTLQIQNPSALGSSTATVLNGATLEISTAGGAISNAMNLAGSGVSNNGAINNVAGNHTQAGAVTLAGASRINATAGTLTLTGGITGTNTNLNLGGTGNVTVNSAITTGTGTVTLDGSGTTIFSGAANTYTGATIVNSGTLNLSKAANTTAVAGNLIINGGTVSQTASNQIATTSNVSLNAGAFALGTGVNNTFSSINSASGSTLSLGSGAVMTINSSASNALGGNISGAGALATAGTGTVILGGVNTFSGGATVASIVAPISNSAFGTGTVAVNRGGTVETQNFVTLANNFTINSTGTTAYNGAIENISGNTTLTGTVTLAGNSRVQSDGGTFAASGTIALGANPLNVGGSGNITISGPLTGTTASSLTKDGAGTLALGGNNASFAGAVMVSAGTVLANAANVFNSSNAITVNTGSILNLNDFNQTIASLNSSGALALGAGSADTLTLSSGASTLAGSLTGAGTIIVSPGASLTLGANFNAPSVNIVLNGGSLFLGGTTDTFGTLTFQSSSILDFGASTASVLSANNVVIYNGAAVTINNWINAQDYFYVQTTFQGFNSSTGTFTNVTPGQRGVAPQNQLTFTGFTAANTQWSSDHQVTPAPEPATYGLVFTPAAIAFFLWRRRNNCATFAS